MNINVVIKNGEHHLKEISISKGLENPNNEVVIIHIRTKTEYPEITLASYNRIYAKAGITIKGNIEIDIINTPNPEEWEVFHETDRYSIRIVYYQNKDRVILWQNSGVTPYDNRN